MAKPKPDIEHLADLAMRIGMLEAQMLRVIIGLGGAASARAVCEQLNLGGLHAFTSVTNGMNRLLRKGVLTRTKRDGVYIYEPHVDIDELSALVLKRLLGPGGDDQDRIICRALEIDPEVGVEELTQLRQRTQALAKRTSHRPK